MMNIFKRVYRAVFYRRTLTMLLVEQLEDTRRSRIVAMSTCEDWQYQIKLYDARIARIETELKAMNIPTLNKDDHG